MRELLDKVEKELEKIGDKGLTSGNLDTTYKLIDILKDIHEAKYYEKMCEEDSYNARGGNRGGRGRYNENRGSSGRSDSYSTHYYPWDDRTERYFERMKEGIDDYSEGRDRYRDGNSDDREQMIKGIEMAMSALVSFVETLYDHTETPKEKDVIKEHIDKLKRL